jgi:hypothetical protein
MLPDPPANTGSTVVEPPSCTGSEALKLAMVGVASAAGLVPFTSVAERE